MSAYDDQEESVSGSVPIECYKFVGTFRTYRYTSANHVVTAATGPAGLPEKYEPITMSRSRIKAGTQEDKTLSLDLEFPFDTDVVMDYAYAQTPPKLNLFVYRQQAREVNAFILYWRGLVRGFQVTNRIAKIQVPSIFSLALQGSVPNVYYQAVCNHVFMDERCKMGREIMSFAATAVGAVGTTLTISGSTVVQDRQYAGGEIVNERSGERRIILEKNIDVLTVGYAFVDMQGGDPLRIYRGCDHSFDTCESDYSNEVNFGGHPYIPPDNPFEGSL